MIDVTALDVKDLFTEIEQSRPARCRFASSVSQLTANQQVDFLELSIDPSVPTSTLMAILDKLGQTASRESINRHRRGECSCRK